MPPSGSAWFLHQLMQACVGVSLELTAQSKGLRYVPREELLSHPRSAGAHSAANPLALPLPHGKTLIPDDLFALENAETRKRFFILEVDRATESMNQKNRGRNEKTTYFGKKVTCYLDLIRAGTIKAWWGIARPNILIVTTNITRSRQILDHLRSAHDINTKYFAVTVAPEFGSNWRVPKALLTHLLDEPWATVGEPRDISQP